ncbi:MAG: PEP-CTERM sorting domain-containing protein [Phycisphaerales bacterium JB063]
METKIALTAALALAGLACPPALAATMDAVSVGSIHIGGHTASNDDGSEYYASGNDDSFSEYGVATFLFTNADFGGSLTDLASATFNLTINDRSFSDGTSLEVLFSADDFDADYTGLDYDSSLFNGLDTADFTSLTSLGVYSVADTSSNGGAVESIALDLSAVEAELIGQINAGSEFQLIIAVTDASHDITYSGVGNTFDPGAPSLTLTAVPEPGSLALVGLGALTLIRRRRA